MFVKMVSRRHCGKEKPDNGIIATTRYVFRDKNHSHFLRQRYLHQVNGYNLSPAFIPLYICNRQSTPEFYVCLQRYIIFPPHPNLLTKNNCYAAVIAALPRIVHGGDIVIAMLLQCNHYAFTLQSLCFCSAIAMLLWRTVHRTAGMPCLLLFAYAGLRHCQ